MLFIKTWVGWLLQLLGWPFITCFFFRIDGLWREFLFGRGSTFVVSAESSPFYPALFLLCRIKPFLTCFVSWKYFLFILNGKHFPEIVKNLEISYYLLIISNLILKLLIAIYIYIFCFEYFFSILSLKI